MARSINPKRDEAFRLWIGLKNVQTLCKQPTILLYYSSVDELAENISSTKIKLFDKSSLFYLFPSK